MAKRIGPKDKLPDYGHILKEERERDVAAAINALDVEERRERAKIAEETLPEGYISAAVASDLRGLVIEKARRRIESLRMYEPLPVQKQFSECSARIRLARGGNRAGKSVTCAIEVASAFLGEHPRFPTHDGQIYVVGKDEDHLADPVWRALGRAGSFKIIRDEIGGHWRAYRPWRKEDAERMREARLAPPLIPPRAIKEIAWKDKKRGVPSVVRGHNGTEIRFYSSLGKPPQGTKPNCVWFDEEISDEDWFPEMWARLTDNMGWLVWSFTPQLGTDHVLDLQEKAAEEIGSDTPMVSEFEIMLASNPHITDEGKRQLAAGLSDEQYRIRILGESAQASYKVYPEFSMLVHGVDAESLPGGQIPMDWTRLAIFDPGYQVAAVLFAAVPPKELGEFVYLYDELYIRNCHADMLAERFHAKAGQERFQAFIIDYRMAIQSEIGVGKTVMQQYQEAFAKRKIRSVATQDGFVLGSPDVPGGLEAVRRAMQVREDGTTRLRVIRGRLHHFEREMKRYINKTENGRVIDKPRQKDNHLCDTMRYLFAFNPRYVKPPKGPADPGGAYKLFKAKQKKQREKDGPQYVHFGPGTATKAR